MRSPVFLLALLAAAGCQTADPAVNLSTAPDRITAAVATGHNHGVVARSLEAPPKDQLAQVRRATARYHDIRNAIADQYEDIGVVLPNMGRHFLKRGLLNASFDLERPELLVYSPGTLGTPKLVAVEYAVPLELSAGAPEGFRGAADQWFADQTFKLWTLHAWVWEENPDGVFNPTNRKVP